MLQESGVSLRQGDMANEIGRMFLDREITFKQFDLLPLNISAKLSPLNSYTITADLYLSALSRSHCFFFFF